MSLIHWLCSRYLHSLLIHSLARSTTLAAFHSFASALRLLFVFKLNQEADKKIWLYFNVKRWEMFSARPKSILEYFLDLWMKPYTSLEAGRPCVFDHSLTIILANRINPSGGTEVPKRLKVPGESSYSQMLLLYSCYIKGPHIIFSAIQKWLYEYGCWTLNTWVEKVDVKRQIIIIMTLEQISTFSPKTQINRQP